MILSFDYCNRFYRKRFYDAEIGSAGIDVRRLLAGNKQQFICGADNPIEARMYKACVTICHGADNLPRSFAEDSKWRVRSGW